MIPGLCVRELRHDFDPVSGWCANGCGWRDDGRSAYREPRRPIPSESIPDITEPRRGAS